MNNNHWIILGAALSLAVLIIGYYVLISGNSAVTQAATGSQSSSGQLASDPNFFAGNVTTAGIPAGTYNGTGIYDHNCLPVGNGIYSCDAGIKTAKYGTIDFTYRHDMMMKPCIGPGDTLVVTVSSGGSATVNRLTGNSGYT